MKSLIIYKGISYDVLDSVKVGDIITDDNITGKVFAIHKGENDNKMQFNFYYDAGNSYNRYYI